MAIDLMFVLFGWCFFLDDADGFICLGLFLGWCVMVGFQWFWVIRRLMFNVFGWFVVFFSPMFLGYIVFNVFGWVLLQLMSTFGIVWCFCFFCVFLMLVLFGVGAGWGKTIWLYEISILGQIVLRAFGDASKAQPGTLKIIRKRVVRKVLDTIDDAWHKQDIMTRNSPSNTRYSWKLHEIIWYIRIFSRNIRKTWVAADKSNQIKDSQGVHEIVWFP